MCEIYLFSGSSHFPCCPRAGSTPALGRDLLMLQQGYAMQGWEQLSWIPSSFGHQVWEQLGCGLVSMPVGSGLILKHHAKITVRLGEQAFYCTPKPGVWCLEVEQ